jgi:tryptophan-rich protein
MWITDNNGNYVSSTTMTGSSSALKTAEPLFHQDLNGDGAIGDPPPPPPPPPPSGTVIESNGVTSLTKVGTNFYMYDGNGAGPSLKFSGAIVVAGQFDAWTPISAEKTATGYQVAWKVTGTEQYGMWITDNNGNYVSSTTMTGSSSALKTAEPLFHQDLNGDGQIGDTSLPLPPPPPPQPVTVIESNGVTSLTAVGNKYYLYNGSNTGPTLKVGGADVVAGQFSGWTPLGAEKTASGYEMAWKTGADQYTVWNTDNNGNKVSDIGTVTGSDPALKSLEASFGQDLNGDGIIGEAAIRGRGVVAAGNDTLTGAAANEALFGNVGNDAFVFARNFVKNTVADVHAADDVLQFSRTAFTDVADVLAHAAQTGADVTVAVDATHAVLPQHDPFHHLV